MTLIDRFRSWVEAQPEAPAFTFLADGEQPAAALSYGELDTRARAVAAALADRRLRGERALLLYPPGLDLVAALVGCLYAGVAAVPAYPPRRKGRHPRLTAIARDALPAVVLSTSSLTSWARDQLPELAGVPWLATDDLPAAAFEPPRLHGEEIALLQYTSGSTSTPKGVVVTHANLLANQEAIRRVFDPSAESVVVSWLPPYHDMGLVGGILQPLYVGGRCYLMSPLAFLRRPARWLEAVSRFGATTSGGPNFAYELACRRVSEAERGQLELAAWRVAFNGAEPVRPETLERFARRFEPQGFRPSAFHPCYGLAEATLLVAGGALGAGAELLAVDGAALERGEARPVESTAGEEPARSRRRLVGYGYQAAGVEPAIVHPETGELLAPGRVGEIWLRGESVARGYWQAPEATAELFGGRLAGDPEEVPHLRTGDLGFLHQGRLFVTGRLKDLVILRGRNLYPQDVERAAGEAHPALVPGGGAAFALEEEGEERLVVAHEVERRFQGSLAAVAAAVRRAVAQEMEAQVAEVVLLAPGALPRTTSGKVRRRACRQELVAGTLDLLGRFTTAAPGEMIGEAAELDGQGPPAVIEALRQEAARALERTPAELDPDQALTAYGLDSLAAVELQQGVTGRLGVAPSLARLFSGASLRELAAEITPRREVGREEAPDLLQLSGAEPQPLSYGQRALWFLARVAPESAAYHLRVAARLTSPVEPARLEAAFQRLVERHPALRTGFELVDGEPRQRVHPRGRLLLERHDASVWTEAELRAELAAESRRPFDLSAPPLLRAGLWTGLDGGPVLLLVVHHVVADFTSLALLARELAELYAGAPPAAPPRFTCADHARWQRERLAGPRGEALWAFWRRRLASAPPVLELPADRPRSRRTGGRAGGATCRLTPEVAAALTALARARGATPFAVLAAAWQATLHRHSGQPELLVGTPTAGRGSVDAGAPDGPAADPFAGEWGELVGYLVNPVVLRSRAGDDPPFATFLERTREEVLGALAHGDFPFPLLVERLVPEREAGRSPLFQVLFSLQPASPAEGDLAALAAGHPGARVRLGELTLEALPLPPPGAQLDLSLQVVPLGGEDGDLAAVLDYDAELFDAATARRLLGHFRNLLIGALAGPLRSVGSLPLLAPAEEAQVLREWNDAPAGPALDDRPLPDHLAARAAARPEAVALAVGEEQLTYGALRRWALAVAGRLAAAGVGPGERVAVNLPRSPELVAALWGILESGAAYLPLEPSLPPRRRAFLLADGRASALLARRRPEGEEGPALPPGLVLLEAPAAGEEGVPFQRSKLPADLPAYLLYTSGSTGEPKGVEVSHRSLLGLLRAVAAVPGLTAGDRLLAVSAVSFDVAAVDLFLPLLTGARLLLAREEETTDGRLLAALLASRRATFLSATPATWQLLLTSGWPGEEGLTAISTGESLTPALAARLTARSAALWNLYGPTEATIWCAGDQVDAGLPPAGGALAVGRPLAGARLLVLDPRLRPQPPGVPGMLHAAGPGLARGYFRRPALTAAAFLPDPFTAEAGGRLYVTGDLARRRPDGCLELAGRRDHQVKLRGHRIELGEVEAALTALPGVAAAVVMLRGEEAQEHHLAAFVRLSGDGAEEGGGEAVVRRLREALAGRLPAYMVPAVIRPLAAFPTTPTGKVDRRALASLQGASLERATLALEAPAGAPTPPRSGLEAALAALWREVLGEAASAGRAPGVEEDFFALGGHSLLAAVLAARIEETFGVRLAVQELFEAPTVAAQAARIQAARRREETAPAREELPWPPATAAGEDTPAPLSFAQEQLWLLDQLEPGSPAYHVPAAARVEGPLAPAALAAALGVVTARHQVLRTRLPWHRGEPAQVAAPAAAVSLPVVDLSALSVEVGEGVGRELLGRCARRPFDLARGPLMRPLLVRLGGRRHLFLLTFHHAVTDGWSLAVLGQELGRAYGAWSAGREPELGPRPLQHRDYASWQRQVFAGGEMADAVAVWRRRLAGLVPLELPADHPREPRRLVPGRRQPVTLPGPLAAELAAVGRQAGATPFMVLLALFQGCLARTTGALDLAVGTPVANRGRPGLATAQGPYVNLLVLRADLGADPSFRRLVAQTRREAVAAWAHEELPFELLVRELAPVRTPDRNPLVQAAFVLQSQGLPRLELPGLAVVPVEVDPGASPFDLHLDLRPGEAGGLAGFFSGRRDLFDATSLARLARRFTLLAAEAVAAPELPLSRLATLTDGERHQLLWEGRRRRVEAGLCLHQLFELQALRRPDAVAVTDGRRRLTYGELAARSGLLARRLQAAGVETGSRVGLLLSPSAELVVSILGVLAAGAAYVPIDPGYPARRRAFVAADAQVRALLTTRALAGEAPAVEGPVLAVEEELGERAAPEGGSGLPAVPPQAPAYLIYTSGSTGEPKGVVVSHAAAVRLFAVLRGELGFGPKEVWSLFHSYAFDFSVWELWGALAHGGRLVVVPAEVSRAPAELLRLLARERVTVLSQTPSAFRQLARAEEELGRAAGPLALSWVIFGGEALDFGSLAPWFRRHGDRRPRLANLYGITETTVHATFQPLAAEDPPAPLGSRIGRPLADLEVLVLDPALEPVALGVAGELCVAGEGLAQGYHRRPGLTALRFVPHPAPARPGERLYRSGDRGRLLPGGGLEYLGRLDTQVKLRGFRVEPGEVEAALSAQPAVAECAVAVQPGPAGEDRLVAYVVPRPPPSGAEPSAAALRSALAARLPGHMVPGSFVLLPSLPLTAHGKLDRRALPPPEEGGDAPVPASAPRTPAEAVLAALFREVLGRSRVGIHDSFFELGGHSLAAARLASLVRRRLGADLPVQALFERPTVATLAGELAAALESAGEALAAPLPPGVEPPLSPVQEGIWLRERQSPGRGAYNVAAAVDLAGAVAVAALAGAFATVVGRHAVLRSSFPLRGGAPRVRVAPRLPLPLPVVDLSGLADGPRRRLSQELSQVQARLPFDLERGPLLRLGLLRLRLAEHRLVVILHHLVADGESMGLLVREVSAAYRARLAGGRPELPPLPLQYGDYAAWQRRRLAGEAAVLERAARRRRLAQRAPLELPGDRPRPASPGGRGGTLRHRLEPGLAEVLQRTLQRAVQQDRQGRGEEAETSLFMLLTAAFGALLARLTHRRELPLATVVSLRDRPELEGLIGPLVNTLLLDLDLAGDPPFAQACLRVRREVLAAYAWRELPLEGLGSGATAEEQPGGPAPGVFFQLQEVRGRRPELPDLTTRVVDLDPGAAKFDLVVTAEVGEEEVAVIWRYDADLFDATTVRRLARSYDLLLAGAAVEPERSLGRLPLLAAGEAHQLLREWSGGGRRAPAPEAETLHGLFARRAGARPDVVAVTAGREQLSYGALAGRAALLARRLSRRGVGAGTWVGLAAEPGLELVEGVLGILAAGGAYVPLDPSYPEERRSFILADSGVERVVVQQGLPAPPGVETVWLDGRAEPRAAPEPAALAGGGLPGGSAAYLLYTSGSTGRPKGVVVPHHNVLALLAATRELFAPGPEEVWSLFHSYAFDFSVWEIWGALAHGGRLVVVDRPTRLSPGRLWELLVSRRVTVLSQTPSAFRSLARAGGAGREPLTALRRVIFGGEALEPAVLAGGPIRPGEGGARLANLYGITETTVHVTCRELTAGDLASAGRSPVGRPLPGWRVQLVDGGGRPVPAGVAGEILVGGPGLTRGYWRRPGLTAERFVPDPFGGAAGERLYRSGDLARWRPDGDLDYLGRIDHQLKVRGFRVEPGEIEAALLAHPAVVEAAVAARRVGEDPAALVAYGVLLPGARLSAEEVRAFLAARLPEAMVPALFLSLTELPRSPVGKLDRRALPGPEAVRRDPVRRYSEQPYAAPRDRLEELLSGLWGEVLGVDRVGVEEDFFELGGTSLTAAVLANRLQEALGEIFHVVTLFDEPTVQALAAHLRRQHPRAVARLVPAASPEDEAADARGRVGVWTAGAEGLPPASERELVGNRAAAGFRTPTRAGSRPLQLEATEETPAVGEAEVAAFRALIPPLTGLDPHPRANPRAVFILAPPRSGTTLLRVMLAGHPGLFAPPELELLSFHTLAQRRQAFQGRDRFWLEGSIRALMEAASLSAGEATERFEAWEEEGITTREAYRRLQALLGERLLVDKTPSYALDPAILRRAELYFRRPLYLHLLRHPAATVHSFVEAKLDQLFFRHRHPFHRRQLAELIWLVSHENVLSFLATVPAERQHRVRFEELVRDPEGVLAGVCAFLDLPYAPEMARPYEAPEGRMTDGLHAASRMLGDVKLRRHRRVEPEVAERWRGQVAEEELGEPTRRLAAQLGYPPAVAGWLQAPVGAPTAEADVDAGPAALLSPIPRSRWEEGEAPLSAAQERLWFLDQLTPGSPAYHIAARVSLSGRLEVRALAVALAAIRRRHGALRARFPAAQEGPVQRVEAPGAFHLPVVDLSALETPGEAAATLARREARRPFELARGPLVRFHLLRRGAGEHRLLAVFHHIVADGWSLGIFARELAALYRARVEGSWAPGRPVPLPSLPVQYADFARWQRRLLAGDALAPELEHWRRRLAGAPPLLPLPLDRPRRPGAAFASGVLSFHLPEGEVSALERLARARGATLYMALLATFAAWLRRESGAGDLVVGTPVAGRSRRELEGLVGFFVNTLPLRLDLAGEPTYDQLLERVGGTVREALGHQELPFARLVEELAPERQASYPPLVQVVFAYQEAPPAVPDLPGLATGLETLETGAGKFDWTLSLTREGSGVAAWLEYNAELFDATTVRRAVGHWRRLLAAAGARPGTRMDGLPLLSAGERHQLLAGWNDTAQPLPAGASIHGELAAAARRRPEAVAVGAGGEQLTYGALLARAGSLAGRLRRRGVGPEVPVALCLPRGAGAVTALAAVLTAGGAYLPLEPDHPPERHRLLLQESGARLLLTTAALAGGLPLAPAQLLLLDAPPGAEDGTPPGEEAAPVPALAGWSGDAGQLAYVLFTSGSTGRPKGVAVSHGNVLRLARGLAAVAPLDPGQTVLHDAPLAFDASTFEIWATLLAGARLAPAPPRRLSTAELARFLAAERVTTAWLTAGLFHQMVEEEGAGLSPLDRLLAGGDALAPARVAELLTARPDLALVNGYGPTEATTFTCCALLDAREAAAGRVPIGRPVGNTRVYLLDRRLRPVPPGAAGELAVAGDGLARGYHRRPGRTAELFVPAPPEVGEAPGRRLYLTGDRVRFLADGRLELLGRLDQQVKLRGFRVEPGEVEALLAAHPAVRQCAVVVRRDGPGGPHLAAYAAPAEGADRESLAGELAAHLRSHLPPFMLPAAWAVLPELPLTASGKVDRRALPEAAVPEAGAGEGRRPRTPVEELLVGIWSQVLERPEVAVDGDFFALGGHSLLATRAVSRLRAALEVELPLEELFLHPTPARLAPRVEEALAAGRRGGAPPLEPVSRLAPLPLSFAQRRLWILDRIDPGMTAYDIPLAVRLAGELRPRALAGALAEIEARHETLRTVFTAGAEGEPVQEVRPAGRRPLPRVELAGLPAAAARRAARPLARRHAHWRFDLARGPVWHAALVTLEPGEHLLLVALHHIAADGWSLGVLLAEVAALYEAFAAGRPSPLPALPVQYADFAAWQHRWLAGPVMEELLAYWRQSLAGAPAVLDLPTDRPRPPVQSFRGRRLTFPLPAPLAGALEAVSRGQGVTLFMTLLAAFAGLLDRHAGHGEVVVGTPIANRTRLETEGLIGFFVNTLVLRCSLAGDPPFRELLARVRRTALGAYAHQDLPFEELVDALHPERNLAVSPLFQVMFSLQNAPLPALEIPGLALAPLEVDPGTAKFDLTLAVAQGRPGGGGAQVPMSASLEYNTDLFDATNAQRLTRRFQRLLEAAVADPDRPLSRLPLLATAEAHQVVVEANDRAVPLPGAGGVQHLFARAARRHGEETALIQGEESLSYRELSRRVARLAGRLQVMGVGPGVVTGVSLERGFDLVTGLWGVLWAGGAFLPLDPGYPPERLAFMLEDAGAGVLISAGSEAGEGPLAGFQGRLVDVTEALGDGPGVAPAEETGAGDLAYLIYTSGSTGRPKGVMVEHGNVMSFFAAMDRVLAPAEERAAGQAPTWLAVTSASFDISVLELLWTLTRGFRVVVSGEEALTARRPATPDSAARRAMDFSLFYFASDETGAGEPPGDGAGERYRLLLEGARFADAAGLAAVWTPERHFHAFGGLYPNPSVTAAAVAAVTRRVGVRAGSVVLPLHDPLRVAEEWSVVDNLSGGRVGVSFASGWHADDFVLAPERYAGRKAAMLEGIETVRRLWRGEAVRRRGGGEGEVEVRIHPPPVQPELPVWLTAAGNPETFRLAGERGYHLLTHLLGQEAEELAGKIDLYRRARAAASHGPGKVSLMLHTFVGADLESVRAAVRRPFLRYLATSTGLLARLARRQGRNVGGELTPDELATLGEPAFERYFRTSGLMGTMESCLETVERLAAIGVDEVACLIDFGVPTEAVLASLPALDELRRRWRPAPAGRPVRRAGERPSLPPLAQELRRHRVTHLQCTPSLATLLLADADTVAALAGLRELLLGGEELPPALAERLRGHTTARLHNVYGPTETTVWSSAHRLPAAIDEVEERATVPIGRPLANGCLYVLDPSGRPAPLGVPGELAIGGAGVVRGYLGRPALTAERFVPDPFSSGGRLYLTGDAARLRPDGLLEHLGRLDRQVKIRGVRVELGEVEGALRAHPGVAEAAVVAREGEGGDRRLVAYLVATGGGPPAPRPAVEGHRRDELLAGHRCYTLPNGMLVAHHDARQARAVYDEVFTQGVYLRHGIRLADGDCLFDVGANAGFFTLWASSLCRPSRVFAFEPLPPNFALLQANTALYGVDCQLFQAGVAAEPGEAEFTFYPAAAGLSGLAAHAPRERREVQALVEAALAAGAAGEAGRELSGREVEEALAERLRSRSYRCPLTTLSQVIRRHGVERIDLLKVDVERSEVAVLRGIDDEDWGKIHQVVVEVHGDELLAGCREILEGRGLQVAVDEDFVTPDGTAAVYMLYARRPGAEPAPAPVPPAPPAPAPAADLGEEVRAFLRRRLPEPMIPAAFVLLPALPRTPNGKLDRRALPAPEAVAGTAHAPYAPPESRLEKLIAGVWRQVLKTERIGRDDNFFEVGGNSLTLAVAAGKLQEALDRPVPIVELFRFPTLRSLAAHLGSEPGGEEEAGRPEETAELAAGARERRSARQRRRRLKQERRGEVGS